MKTFILFTLFNLFVAFNYPRGVYSRENKLVLKLAAGEGKEIRVLKYSTLSRKLVMRSSYFHDDLDIPGYVNL